MLNVYLFYIVPKGFFPQQDTGRLNGSVLADQDTSFQAMNTRLQADDQNRPGRSRPSPIVVGFTGGGGGTRIPARMFITLKPLDAAQISAEPDHRRICAPSWPAFPARRFIFRPSQDLRIGGRSSNAHVPIHAAERQLQRRREWAPKLLAELQKIPILTDVNSDQQNHGPAGAC